MGILQVLFAKMYSVFSPKNRYFDWQDYTGITQELHRNLALTDMPKQAVLMTVKGDILA